MPAGEGTIAQSHFHVNAGQDESLIRYCGTLLLRSTDLSEKFGESGGNYLFCGYALIASRIRIYNLMLIASRDGYLLFSIGGCGRCGAASPAGHGFKPAECMPRQ